MLKYWTFSQWAFIACFPKDTCFQPSWRATDFYFIILFYRAVLLISVSGNKILSHMDRNRRIWTQIFSWQQDTWHCEIYCCLPGWVTGAESTMRSKEKKKQPQFQTIGKRPPFALECGIQSSHWFGSETPATEGKIWHRNNGYLIPSAAFGFYYLIISTE